MLLKAFLHVTYPRTLGLPLGRWATFDHPGGNAARSKENREKIDQWRVSCSSSFLSTWRLCLSGEEKRSYLDKDEEGVGNLLPKKEAAQGQGQYLRLREWVIKVKGQMPRMLLAVSVKRELINKSLFFFHHWRGLLIWNTSQTSGWNGGLALSAVWP